jgi:hypothetical protein
MTAKPGGNSNDALSPDFRDFIETLNSAAVDFVLVGGYAVGAYGVVRATSDIDFLYRRTAYRDKQRRTLEKEFRRDVRHAAATH